jgi:prepilin-type N-terminal cleavage/methylation domain-containing protein
MRHRRSKAFSFIELLAAIAVLAIAVPILTNAFLANVLVPRLDSKALALIFDMNNCVTNIDKIGDARNVGAGTKNGVHCFSDPDGTFTARKIPVNGHVPRNLPLTLYKISISGHPSGAAEAYFYANQILRNP